MSTDSKNNKLLIIFPCEYIGLNTVDETYAFEKETAEQLGFETINMNYDEFIMGVKLKLSKSIENSCKAVYRGWMMQSYKYSMLYDSLKELGIELVITPDKYEATHYFVRSYDKIKEYTAKTIWFSSDTEIDWTKVREKFDKFIVKDYVKSVKGFEFPKYLESNMGDNELSSYIYKFKQLRGNLYTGGIVFKEYLNIEPDKEYRAFYINNKLAFIYKNGDNIETVLDVPDIIKELASKDEMRLLDSKFYTIDFGIKTSGEAVLIELGDGQVSGVPNKKVAEMLYKNLKEM